jgi:hypothetical protein
MPTGDLFESAMVGLLLMLGSVLVESSAHLFQEKLFAA